MPSPRAPWPRAWRGPEARGCGSHGIRFANPTGSTALLLETRREQRRDRGRARRARPHITPGGGEIPVRTEGEIRARLDTFFRGGVGDADAALRRWHCGREHRSADL